MYLEPVRLISRTASRWPASELTTEIRSQPNVVSVEYVLENIGDVFQVFGASVDVSSIAVIECSLSE